MDLNKDYQWLLTEKLDSQKLFTPKRLKQHHP